MERMNKGWRLACKLRIFYNTSAYSKLHSKVKIYSWIKFGNIWTLSKFLCLRRETRSGTLSKVKFSYQETRGFGTILKKLSEQFDNGFSGFKKWAFSGLFVNAIKLGSISLKPIRINWITVQHSSEIGLPNQK